MEHSDRAISEELRTTIMKRWGDAQKELIEEHLNFMDQEHQKSEFHKKKYYRTEQRIRVLAFVSGVSGSVLALWTFETNEVALPVWIKVVLTLSSVFASFAIVALGNTSAIDRSRETWIRHRTYVNECIGELLGYADGVGDYADSDRSGPGAQNAKKHLLEQLVSLRNSNNARFHEYINK